MSQDLRKLFEGERERSYRMPEGHEDRFSRRLDEAFPRKRQRPILWIGIAASVVALLGLGFWGLQQRDGTQLPVGSPQTQPIVKQDSVNTPPGLSLGDLSPDLKKVEQFYTANINMELASLDIDDESKAMADDFMARLRELDTEYSSLVRELNEIGPNEETITAMIKNFQLRLQLLQRLKTKLNELKQSNNETVSSNSV